MKQSEQFRQLANESESDMGFLGYDKRANRWSKYEDFVENILPKLKLLDNIQIEQNKNDGFIFYINSIKTYTFYPKSNKLNYHKDNSWKTRGLNIIKKLLK